MCNSVAHSGHPFHPIIVEPPVSIEDDGEGEEQEEEGSLSMDPSTMQGLIVSDLANASAVIGLQSPH